MRRSSALALVLAMTFPLVAPVDAQGQNDDDTCTEAEAAPKPKGKKQQKQAKDAADECKPKPPPPPPVLLANLRSPAPTAIDIELQAALTSVGMLDTWYSLTLSNPRLSLVLASGADADPARQAVLDQLGELIDTRESTTVLLNVTQDTVGRRRLVERQIAAVDEQIASLTAQRLAAVDTRTTLEYELSRVLNALRDAAVGMYVNDEQVTVGGIDDVGTYNDQRELAERVDATIEELLSQRDELEARIATQEARIAELTANIDLRESERAGLESDRAGLTETIAKLRNEIADLTTRRVELELALPASIGAAHTARMTASAPALGISMVSLDSYVQAAEHVRERYPACEIRWQHLAGIATVESNHGTFGGAYVYPNGVVSQRILGPVLDGTLEDTAIITDTDGGRLDGNAAFDRALGPFQFIPGTWRSYGIDGDDDGIADPHNMYDGAFSAAGYLCTSSNMFSDSQVARSVLSYNGSGQYLHDVTRFAANYIVNLALPEAAYDPDTLVPDEGWTLILSESNEWVEIGHIGRTAGPDTTAQVAVDPADELFDRGQIFNTGD